MPQRGGDGLSIEFYYPPVWVTVTTPYRLDVQPNTTVKPGSTLSISSIGGGCKDPATYPQVGLYSASKAQVANATITNSDTKGWGSRLLVPKKLSPGTYRVEADCVEGYAVWGSYALSETKIL
jgi:hypothetical protein